MGRTEEREGSKEGSKMSTLSYEFIKTPAEIANDHGHAS